jgi:DNA mismatch repair ATPase MutS
LSQLVAVLSSRRNVYFAPIAGLLLWATQLAFIIEAWRRRHGGAVPAWIDAIGQFEALAAVAGFAAEHPGFVFPTLADGAPARFDAAALAHPLLPASAIANDITLGGDGPVLLLVSGSNMSGKSTFLRTIGLTAVLSQLGAPVRATACTLSPLAIGASIRVLDSLQEGHSRFYAEILRLKQIVDLARASQGQMLFLLDEMLSGTNSHDRRHGAEGVLRGLTTMRAIGLATTHDLALGDIVATLGRPAAQVHFSDVFDAGTLQFDYQLRPGPVRTSNALALMRSIGLEIGNTPGDDVR